MKEIGVEMENGGGGKGLVFRSDLEKGIFKFKNSQGDSPPGLFVCPLLREEAKAIFFL